MRHIVSFRGFGLGIATPSIVVPNPVNWNNTSSAGTEATTNIQQITGTNVPINLTISWTGNLGNFYVSVNDSNAYGGIVYFLDASPYTISVAPDKYIGFRLNAVGLQDSLNRNVTVANASDSGTILDTFTIDVAGTTTKTDDDVFNIFYDREMITDRYDATTSSSAARGWNFR